MRFRLYFTHGDATDYEAASYKLDWPRIELFNTAGERVLSYYDADIAAVREVEDDQQQSGNPNDAKG